MPEKKPYDPPQITVVQIQIEERVLGCNYSTVKYCGITE